MTKRTLTLLIAAILGVGAVTAVLAASVGGGDSSATHMMPNGQTMQGSGMHTMSTGTTMSNDEMHSDGK